MLTSALIAPLCLAAVAVPALVISDQRAKAQSSRGRFLFKPLSALAFLWLALAAGATESSYGQWLLAGLLLSACGEPDAPQDEGEAQGSQTSESESGESSGSAENLPPPVPTLALSSRMS